MKKHMYFKMAWLGIQKNRRLYLPYIITCVSMVMMSYIVSFLQKNEAVTTIYGGATIQLLLGMGIDVLRVFTVIFLFYTNSFLIRRRKKEFGLYNVLGMGKKHLGIVLIWEHLILATLAIGSGLFFGVIFSKMSELGLIYIMHGVTTMEFSVNFSVILQTMGFFCIVFLLLFLNTLRQIHVSNPMELLSSEHSGEKPPKRNWVVALLGIILLVLAYRISLKINHPIEATFWFFVAVTMVIIGTYGVFISGSVVLCKMLMKNKKYYYKTNHFLSVSAMTYRMKRNGAGLASICILCTMILVMLSSSICLYAGLEETLRTMYPRNIVLQTTSTDMEKFYDAGMNEIPRKLKAITDKKGLEQKNILQYRIAGFAAMQVSDTDFSTTAPTSVNDSNIIELEKCWQIFVVGLDDYNRLNGVDKTLQPGELLLYTGRYSYEKDTISIHEKKEYTIKEHVPFNENGIASTMVTPSMFLIVPDLSEFVKENQLFELLDEENSNQTLSLMYQYGFDLKIEDDIQQEIAREIQDEMQKMITQSEGNPIIVQAYVEDSAKGRGNYYSIYGGLFFLGIVLGLVFVFATVLIIYYKQISEGYEDQARFEILQKVGVSKREIKKSINSQILTVFFLPLLLAGIHLAFAYPIISKLLLMFGMNDQKLFILVTAFCYFLFACCYVMVYKVTSRAYYKIVSGT